MQDEVNKNKFSEIQIKDLAKVLIRRKWWFIGIFIMVLAAGILFTFLRIPQFSVTSSLVINTIEAQYFENLMQTFPEKTNELVSINNVSEGQKFYSDDLLEKAIDDLEFDISIDELKDSIYIYTVKNGILRLTTVHADADSVYEMNKALFENYLSKRNAEINKAYEDLLNEVDSELNSTLEEIEDLSQSSEDADVLTDREIELKYEAYYSLEENKKILIENKSFFVDRIAVEFEPEISNIYGYFNYKRDIFFSILLAIALGLISAFAIDYFQSLRKKQKS